MTKTDRRNSKYHYTECGLKNIWLLNGFNLSKTPYGETVRIENIEGLHKAIGFLLAKKSTKLNSREFRFLRNELTMSQNTLSELLGISEQTVARWEKEETKIPHAQEAIIRKLYLEKMGNHKKLKKLLDEIADLEDKIDRLVLKKEEGHWKQAVAA